MGMDWTALFDAGLLATGVTLLGSIAVLLLL